MASNYNRKSASSASRRAARDGQPAQRRAGASARQPQARPYRVVPGGQYAGGQEPVTSVRVGDIDRRRRNARAERGYRRYLVRVCVALAVVAALAAGGVAVYWSSLFTIESIEVTGVEHLTSAEMQALANVSEGTTLLRVDVAGVKARILEDAWVESVKVKRTFPDTLTIVVTERTIAAVVEVPSEDASTTQDWAIASAGMWLMPIPDQDSEAGQATSEKVYEDAAAALVISDAPYDTDPEVGEYCTNDNVNNALSIVANLTTELADQVSGVQATEAESTTLVLESGVEVAFGAAEDIRAKERVVLQIMEDYPDVVYINVRDVDSPTWRAV